RPVQGTEKAGASKSFTATTEAPAAPGGAGGGGGGAPITGAVIPKVKYLFDINTEILSDYLFVKPGGKIMAKITLYNFGTEEVKDAKLTNYIKNSEGEIILEGIETISVYIKSQVIKQFIIPINSSTGIYSFHADVEYNNKKAMSEAEFEVIGEEKAILPKKEPFKFKLSYLWILLVSIVIIIILYRIYMVIKGIRERKDRMVVIKDIKVLLSEKK
ncbi:MAG: hypothetical protein KJ767_00460, partial [Nanoarchaeota archaeon]|nr:hypothetical protein [Nanoarchaeota archaeon]